MKLLKLAITALMLALTGIVTIGLAQAATDPIVEKMKAWDPDKDGTLTKDEYLTIVEERFKAADADNDGTV